MEKYTAQRLVHDTLKAAFDRKRYRDFVNEICNGFDESKAISSMTVPDAFVAHVKSCQRLGTFTALDGELADVLVVQLTESYKLDRTRTALRDFVAHKLKRGEGNANSYKEAGLVAFVAPDSQSWRFSYVRMEYENRRDPKTGKIKPEERLTPARRYSYLVGADEECHTAQSRFLALLQNTADHPTLPQIEEAFSVEAVTKEFFREYARLFADTEAALAAVQKRDKAVRDDFQAKGVSTVDFAKKLLGQIVFLYFIQKKGWLGVAKGANWGDGPRSFMRLLADRAMAEKQCLFDDVLEPLFYDTLATDRGHAAWCATFQCRIPFLNGGLFEPLAGYEWKKTKINLPNSLFTNRQQSLVGDVGTGILDVFDRYNFTVNEAEPLEKEVAIDPEMLGKVFENLIEENRRKGLGAYYTPREIVHYMCQESLINYLDNGLNRPAKPRPGRPIEVPRKDLEDWIRQSDQFGHYAAAMAAGTKGANYPKPPQSIRTYAADIDALLRDITVCDPAIGSGAFPVGMMTEIVRARAALTPYFNDVADRTPYHFKRHAIQCSLYGADIDPGAVEIAKLRLWLSLVVDEQDVKQIKPLPNLDYKVVVGNSLIGVEKDLFNDDLFKRLEILKPRFFDESDRVKKAGYKTEIDAIIRTLTTGKEIFDFEIYFSEVFHNHGGFHIVLGNPPYVGQSGNKDVFRVVLETSFGKRYHQRRMDYFYFFFHKALLLARPYGVVAFITTNYYFTATYADKLRKHIKESALVARVVDLGNVKLFHSAQGQHNAVTILMNERRDNFAAEIAVTRRQGNIDEKTLNTILAWKDTETSYRRISNAQLFDGPTNCIRFPVDLDNEHGLLDSLLSKIGTRGVPLVTLADIVQGIVTGANQATEKQIQEYELRAQPGDGIFVLDDVEVQRLHLSTKEHRFIKPWYKNSDIDRWVTSRETARRLIYIRADCEVDDDYIPNLVRHFTKFKRLLINRNIRTGSITERQYDSFVRGAGDVPYVMIKSAFAAGRYFCVSYAREESVFTGEKIVCPQFSPANTFAFNDGEWFAASDVYFIKAMRGNAVNLKYVLGLLNSRLCYFWLYHKGQRKGKLLQLFKGPLSAIPIAPPGGKGSEAIASIVDRILATKERDAMARTDAIERQLDELVYALYDLTSDEIKIVEATAK